MHTTVNRRNDCHPCVTSAPAPTLGPPRPDCNSQPGKRNDVRAYVQLPHSERDALLNPNPLRGRSALNNTNALIIAKNELSESQRYVFSCRWLVFFLLNS